MFSKQISSGNVKIKIYKKYKLKDIAQAHKDLEEEFLLALQLLLPSLHPHPYQTYEV